MKTKMVVTVLLVAFLIVSCTPVVKSTPSETAIPTGSLTPIPLTPTSTSNSSSTEIPQSSLLFQQDFETGPVNNIYNDGIANWSIVSDDTGNHTYCNSDSNEYSFLVFGRNNTWANYAVEIKIKAQELSDTNAVLLARFNGNIGYYGTLNFKTHISGLKLGDPFNASGWKSFQGDTNSWQTWRLEVAGKSISYYINNQLIASLKDSELSDGMAGIYIFPHFKICFDDIRVWALTSDGQIAQAPSQPIYPPRSLMDRLASHKFPKLFYQNQDNYPSTDALTQSAYWDILTFSNELTRSDWGYLGPSGSIRSKNPNAVILTVISAQEFFPWDDTASGKDFVSRLKPEWIMRDTSGNPFPSFCCYNSRWSIMMNLSTDVSTFIPDYMNETEMKTGLFDGIFYDGTNEVWWQAQPASNRPGGPIDINNDGKADTTAQLNTAMDTGLQKLLGETRRVFPSGSLITGNTGWDGSLLLDKNSKTDTILANLLNGRMIEGFLNWNAQGIDWLKSMRAYYLMQQVSVEPRIPLIMAYCTGKDYDHLRYTLASSLMFDGYFTCTNSQETGAAYTANWWYDEYSIDLATGKAVQSLNAKGYLGLPVTEAYNVNDQSETLATLLTNNDPKAEQLAWRRDFQNGIVLVNPSDSSRTIELNGTYRKILGILDPKFNDGSQVTKITLPPQSGIILLTRP